MQPKHALRQAHHETGTIGAPGAVHSPRGALVDLAPPGGVPDGPHLCMHLPWSAACCCIAGSHHLQAVQTLKGARPAF